MSVDMGQADRSLRWNPVKPGVYKVVDLETGETVHENLDYKTAYDIVVADANWGKYAMRRTGDAA